MDWRKEIEEPQDGFWIVCSMSVGLRKHLFQTNFSRSEKQLYQTDIQLPSLDGFASRFRSRSAMNVSTRSWPK